MTRRVATIACEGCGTKVPLTITKKGLLTYNCTAADCGRQVFSRSSATDRRLAARAEAWTDNQVRAELGAGPKAEPPKPVPAPPKPAEKPASFWDRPII